MLNFLLSLRFNKNLILYHCLNLSILPFLFLTNRSFPQEQVRTALLAGRVNKNELVGLLRLELGSLVLEPRLFLKHDKY